MRLCTQDTGRADTSGDANEGPVVAPRPGLVNVASWWNLGRRGRAAPGDRLARRLLRRGLLELRRLEAAERPRDPGHRALDGGSDVPELRREGRRVVDPELLDLGLRVVERSARLLERVAQRGLDLVAVVDVGGSRRLQARDQRVGGTEHVVEELDDRVLLRLEISARVEVRGE